MPITYVLGDATRPQGEGLKVIVHCCNDVGAWGAGFVVALSRRWLGPEEAYRRWFVERGVVDFKNLLGAVQLVPVEEDIWVANLIGQVGLRKGLDGAIPVRYDALAQGFMRIASHAAANPDLKLSAHMPRLGCGLAGGSWDAVEPLIEKHLVAAGVPVTVYDLP
jgi:O-acetyl-ADP-ribose deacetylase (regulator of RNase III)